MGVCGIFRPPVQGGSNELISKFSSSMILCNHPSYFKSGEINSCRLSPLPTSGKVGMQIGIIPQDVDYEKLVGEVGEVCVGWDGCVHICVLRYTYLDTGL